MLREFLASLRDRVMDAADRGVVHRAVRGLPVVVHNSRPDILTSKVLERLDAALALIEQHQPWHFRRFRRDFAGILVQRYPCRGAFIPATRVCIVELTFTVNPGFTPAQIAATILHEAMHARLHAARIPHTPENAARHERFCRRAEIEFGRMVPGGEPIVERAMASLELEDEEVAPDIDWELAARRVQEMDEQAKGRRAD